MAVFTTRLNLKKPAGGSSGTIPGDDQADIDDINDNMDIVDESMGFRRVASTGLPATPFDGQPVALTDANDAIKLRAGTEWKNPGVIPSGTTSQRDAYYPAPGSAAARVALAATTPRWFNTDKGYVQLYHAQFDDPSVGTAPAAVTHGWKPDPTYGRIMLDRFTITKDGAPGTVTKKGGRVEVAGAIGVFIDGVFTDDFDEYEIDVVISGASVDLSLQIQWRAAGVSQAGANYAHSFREVASGVGLDVALAGQTSSVWMRSGTAGGFGHLRVVNPKSTSRQKFWTFHCMDAASYTRHGGGYWNVTGTAVDGVRFWSGSGATFTGEIYIYGIPKPR